MAKKKAESKNVPPPPEPAVDDEVMRHARIELPDRDYERLRSVAKRYRLSIAAYIRQAVLKEIERDEGKR